MYPVIFMADVSENSLKTHFHRKAICEDIRGKLMTFGVLNPDDFPPIKKLFEIMAEYEKPDNTQSFSGRIPFPEIDRFIEYKLPMRLCNEASVRMVTARPPTARPGFRQQRKPTKAQAEEAEKKKKKADEAASTSNPASPAQ
jgi:hypothetical protein